MSDNFLSVIATVAVGGIASLLVTWVTDGLDAARRSRRLEQLRAALDSKNALPAEHAGQRVLEMEITALLEDIERGAQARPYWRSMVQYVVGVAILLGLIIPLHLLLFPASASSPWSFVFLVIPILVIFAIESRPIFLTLFRRTSPRAQLQAASDSPPGRQVPAAPDARRSP